MFNKSPSAFDGIAYAYRSTYAAPSAPLKDGNQVAVFYAHQEGCGDIDGFPLFNMTRRVGEVPVNATVSAETLRRLGYSTPTIPDANDSRSFDDAGELLCSL